MKIMVLGVSWGQNWEKYFYISLYWNKSFSTKQQPIAIDLEANYPCIKGI
jgi:hypothetical protein